MRAAEIADQDTIRCRRSSELPARCRSVEYSSVPWAWDVDVSGQRVAEQSPSAHPAIQGFTALRKQEYPRSLERWWSFPINQLTQAQQSRCRGQFLLAAAFYFFQSPTSLLHLCWLGLKRESGFFCRTCHF